MPEEDRSSTGRASHASEGTEGRQNSANGRRASTNPSHAEEENQDKDSIASTSRTIEDMDIYQQTTTSGKETVNIFETSTIDEKELCYTHTPLQDYTDRSIVVEGEVLYVFEHYQRARILFAQSIIDVASDREVEPDTIAAFRTLGVIALLCPLLYDIVPSVQGLALIALGKLAACSQEIAEELVENSVLDLLVFRLKQETEQTESEMVQPCSEHFKKSTLSLLKSIAKHNADLAAKVLNDETTAIFMACLRDPESTVQESAAVTMESIVKHSPDLANAIATENEDLVQQLLLSLPNLPPPGIQATLSMIGEFIKSPEVAKKLVKSGLIMILSVILDKSDETVKRSVLPIFSRLSSLKKKTADKIARTTGSVEYTINAMKSGNPSLVADAMEYLSECLKHSSKILPQLIDGGIIPTVVAYMARREINLASVLRFLSTLAPSSEEVADLVVENKGLEALRKILDGDNTDEEKELALLVAGTIGNYSPEHAKIVAEAGVLDSIAKRLVDPATSSEIRTKCMQNLKKILKIHVHLPTLEILIDDPSSETTGMALFYYNKILRTEGQARRSFVTSGWLKKIQELTVDPHSPMERLVNAIKTCFPPNVIALNNANYMEKLLTRVQKYHPPRSVQPIDYKKAIEDSTQPSIKRTAADESTSRKRKEVAFEEDIEIIEEEEEDEDEFENLF